MRFQSLIIQLALILIVISGCEKNKVNINSPEFSQVELQTLSIKQVGRTYNCSAFINSDGGSPIIDKGICWDTSPNPTVQSWKKLNEIDTNRYMCKITGLQPGTKYYVRAFASNINGTVYGNQLTLKTDLLSTVVIGDSFGGGIVAYILSPGEKGYMNGEVHGIIAAPNDQSNKVVWGGDIYDYIGAGNLNTQNSVNRYGTAESAARVCYDLVINGFDDWYLPCRLEFQLIAGQREAIGNFDSDGYYWSSTSEDNPWVEPNGPFIFSFKKDKVICDHYPASRYGVKLLVRAIRLF
jgi:hypothetical protein